MKSPIAAFSFTALILTVLVLGTAPVAARDTVPNSPASHQKVNRPTPNPYLAAPLYAITHFDSSQSDSTPYGPPRGTFNVDPTTQPISYGGPINIMALASTKQDYMWKAGADKVSYVRRVGEQWTTVANYEALAEADPSFAPIPDANFRIFGGSTAVGMDVTSMDTYMKSLFGDNYADRFGNGLYVLVDDNNVLYAPYAGTLFGFALTNPAKPSAGITVRYRLDKVITAIEGDNPPPPPDTKVVGLSMTYDGHLVVTFSNGVGVIDRDLNAASAVFYRFGDTEFMSNSIAIDENNGIYVAADNLDGAPTALMRKLVWTGTTISDKASDGAWSSPYAISGTVLPPIIKG